MLAKNFKTPLQMAPSGRPSLKLSHPEVYKRNSLKPPKIPTPSTQKLRNMEWLSARIEEEKNKHANMLHIYDTLEKNPPSNAKDSLLLEKKLHSLHFWMQQNVAITEEMHRHAADRNHFMLNHQPEAQTISDLPNDQGIITQKLIDERRKILTEKGVLDTPLYKLEECDKIILLYQGRTALLRWQEAQETLETMTEKLASYAFNPEFTQSALKKARHDVNECERDLENAGISWGKAVNRQANRNPDNDKEYWANYFKQGQEERQKDVVRL